MGVDTHGSHRRGERPRERLSRFLRSRYSGAHAVKALAADMRATPKAAENALLGHWPGDLHFAAIVRRFGRDVLDAVFAPEIEPVLAKLQEEERTLEEALAQARARRRQIEGGDHGGAKAGAGASASARDPSND